MHNEGIQQIWFWKRTIIILFSFFGELASKIWKYRIESVIHKDFLCLEVTVLAVQESQSLPLPSPFTKHHFLLPFLPPKTLSCERHMNLGSSPFQMLIFWLGFL